MTDPVKSTAPDRARTLAALSVGLQWLAKLSPSILVVLGLFIAWPFVMRRIDDFRDKRVEKRETVTLPAVRQAAKVAHSNTEAAYKQYIPAREALDSIADRVRVVDGWTISVKDSTGTDTLIVVVPPIVERIVKGDSALAKADTTLTLARAEARAEKARGDSTDKQLKDVTKQRDRARSRFKKGIVIGAASALLIKPIFNAIKN